MTARDDLRTAVAARASGTRCVLVGTPDPHDGGGARARTAPMRRVLAAVVLLALLTTSACSASVSVGRPQVPTDQLEVKVSAALEQAVGRAPESVDCPDPLPAEQGAEVRCTLTDGGQSLGLTASARAVDDADVDIWVEVDESSTARDADA
ncbi:DUF4333 domain-containing protein [Cellulomonas triticagri]|uniref:DUF4333 domain-containing protein n=1 Tax=Cellulomonas triticagri TaxID=2483352 RepID=A0A3M2J4U3_9CELL|nr:DUF4333 domain-containing protein [Cellulomonas triticagri]RMI09102.1 DUF4333 domain-containing protein [Cellulomonas triticagri]